MRAHKSEATRDTWFAHLLPLLVVALLQVFFFLVQVRATTTTRPDHPFVRTFRRILHTLVFLPLVRFAMADLNMFGQMQRAVPTLMGRTMSRRQRRDTTLGFARTASDNRD
jgi:hypothetical protein